MTPPPVSPRSAPSPIRTAPSAPTSSPAPSAKPSTGSTDQSAFTRTGQTAFDGRTTPGLPADLAEASAKAMTNEQMLQLGETDAGAAALRQMATTMKQGKITPERQAQLDRIDAATFRPAGGLKLDGSAADQKAYLSATRRTMMESPSFAKTMKEINADSKHPVKIKLERDTGTMLDSYKNQTLDLSDLEKLPAKPGAGRPEETTQGAVLAHMMTEQREKALTGNADIAPAHSKAIEAENAYRRDIGQKSMRLMPPDDESRMQVGDGYAITTHFDDGHHEAILFDKDRNLYGTMGYTGPTITPFFPEVAEE